MKTFLSVIIPAYNEELRIGDTLNQITSYLDKQAYSREIIVVNDGSSDKTAEIVSKKQKNIPYLTSVNNPHRGKGFAVKTGMNLSQGDYALFTDADNATPIEETEKLLKALESGSDVAIGSRSLTGSKVERQKPPLRRFAATIGNWLIQIMVLPGIGDTQTGFKMFKRKVVKEIFSKQTLDGFSFDIEVLYLARKNGFQIAQVPIHWAHEKNSRLRFSDFLRVFIDLFKIRLLHH